MPLSSIKASKIDFEKLSEILRFTSEGIEIKVETDIGNVSMCLSDGRVYFLEVGNWDATLFSVKRFFSEIAVKGFPMSAVFEKTEKCSAEFAMDVERFQEMLKKFGRLGMFPLKFKLDVLNLSHVPPTIRKLNGSILTVDDLYKIGYTPVDFVDWVENGFVVLRKASILDVISPVLAGISVIVSFIVILASLLPYDPATITYLKLRGQFNSVLAKKVTGKLSEGFISERDCYYNKIYVKDDAIISAGPDRLLNSRDDVILKLPTKGYKPFFCLP